MKNIIRTITNWEAWPFKLIYAPITPVWLSYIIRSGSVWFFTPSNPKLTFGGMEGEPKKEMYDLLPVHLFPTTFNALHTRYLSRRVPQDVTAWFPPQAAAALRYLQRGVSHLHRQGFYTLWPSRRAGRNRPRFVRLDPKCL